MIEAVKDIFRKQKLKKYCSDVPTGFLPMSQVNTVNVPSAVVVCQDGIHHLFDPLFKGCHFGPPLFSFLYHTRISKSMFLLTGLFPGEYNFSI